MENPEAMLDILTIQSMRERLQPYSTSTTSGNTTNTYDTTYTTTISTVNNGHQTDDADTPTLYDVITNQLTVDQGDLERFVLDFSIDDSISSCFADEAETSWGSVTSIPGVKDKVPPDTKIRSNRPSAFTDISPTLNKKHGKPDSQKNTASSTTQKKITNTSMTKPQTTLNNINKTPKQLASQDVYNTSLNDTPTRPIYTNTHPTYSSIIKSGRRDCVTSAPSSPMTSPEPDLIRQTENKGALLYHKQKASTFIHHSRKMPDCNSSNVVDGSNDNACTTLVKEKPNNIDLHNYFPPPKAAVKDLTSKGSSVGQTDHNEFYQSEKKRNYVMEHNSSEQLVNNHCNTKGHNKFSLKWMLDKTSLKNKNSSKSNETFDRKYQHDVETVSDSEQGQGDGDGLLSEDEFVEVYLESHDMSTQQEEFSKDNTLARSLHLSSDDLLSSTSSQSSMKSSPANDLFQHSNLFGQDDTKTLNRFNITNPPKNQSNDNPSDSDGIYRERNVSNLTKYCSHTPNISNNNQTSKNSHLRNDDVMRKGCEINSNSKCNIYRSHAVPLKSNHKHTDNPQEKNATVAASHHPYNLYQLSSPPASAIHSIFIKTGNETTDGFHGHPPFSKETNTRLLFQADANKVSHHAIPNQNDMDSNIDYDDIWGSDTSSSKNIIVNNSNNNNNFNISNTDYLTCWSPADYVSTVPQHSVNTPQVCDGDRRVIQCVIDGDVKTLLQLLASYTPAQEDFDLSHKPQWKIDLIRMAVQHNSPECLKVLVDSLTSSGSANEALCGDVIRDLSFLCAHHGKSQCLNVLLQSVTSSGREAVLDGDGNSLMHVAVSRGDVEMVLLLISLGLNINCVNVSGITPLDLCHQKSTNSQRDVCQKASSSIALSGGRHNSTSWGVSRQKRSKSNNTLQTVGQSGNVFDTDKSSGMDTGGDGSCRRGVGGGEDVANGTCSDSDGARNEGSGCLNCARSSVEHVLLMCTVLEQMAKCLQQVWRNTQQPLRSSDSHTKDPDDTKTLSHGQLMAKVYDRLKTTGIDDVDWMELFVRQQQQTCLGDAIVLEDQGTTEPQIRMQQDQQRKQHHQHHNHQQQEHQQNNYNQQETLEESENPHLHHRQNETRDDGEEEEEEDSEHYYDHQLQSPLPFPPLASRSRSHTAFRPIVKDAVIIPTTKSVVSSNQNCGNHNNNNTPKHTGQQKDQETDDIDSIASSEHLYEVICPDTSHMFCIPADVMYHVTGHVAPQTTNSPTIHHNAPESSSQIHTQSDKAARLVNLTSTKKSPDSTKDKNNTGSHEDDNRGAYKDEYLRQSISGQSSKSSNSEILSNNTTSSHKSNNCADKNTSNTDDNTNIVDDDHRTQNHNNNNHNDVCSSTTFTLSGAASTTTWGTESECRYHSNNNAQSGPRTCLHHDNYHPSPHFPSHSHQRPTHDPSHTDHKRKIRKKRSTSRKRGDNFNRLCWSREGNRVDMEESCSTLTSVTNDVLTSTDTTLTLTSSSCKSHGYDIHDTTSSTLTGSSSSFKVKSNKCHSAGRPRGHTRNRTGNSRSRSACRRHVIARDKDDGRWRRSKSCGGARNVEYCRECNCRYRQQDDQDDDDDEYEEECERAAAKLDLGNEDLPDEMLRLHRLERHLKSVHLANQTKPDVLETVITGTGERLVMASRDIAVPDVSRHHVNTGVSYPFSHSHQDGRHQDTTSLTHKASSKSKVFLRPAKGNARSRLFNHERATMSTNCGLVPIGKPREMTESEFESMYDRRNDPTVRQRREMDRDMAWSDICWNTESEDTDMTDTDYIV